jgi:hypothetical protein
MSTAGLDECIQVQISAPFHSKTSMWIAIHDGAKNQRTKNSKTARNSAGNA